MTKEAWVDAISEAAKKYLNGDSTHINLMAQMIVEFETAKQMLRDVGFGCTGMGIVETVNEVLESI